MLRAAMTFAVLFTLVSTPLVAQPCDTAATWPTGPWVGPEFGSEIEFMTTSTGVTPSGATLTLLTPLVPGEAYVIEYALPSGDVVEEHGVLSANGCSMEFDIGASAPITFARAWTANGTAPTDWIRGDVNNDGVVNVADPVHLLYLIYPNPGPVFRRWYCPAPADANDDGVLNIADALTLLNGLYNGDPIPAPFPDCGPDPTPTTEPMLSCEAYWECP